MDGFTSTHKSMFKREGKEINGWIHKTLKATFGREEEQIKGWIRKHSQSHVQERRRGDKWM